MFQVEPDKLDMKRCYQDFPSGFLNEGPRDSLCGVKGSLIYGFVVLKRLKLLPKQ